MEDGKEGGRKGRSEGGRKEGRETGPPLEELSIPLQMDKQI